MEAKAAQGAKRTQVPGPVDIYLVNQMNWVRAAGLLDLYAREAKTRVYKPVEHMWARA
ncbi:hypothetical protein ACE6H2_023600 [Prunus campanulata]